MAKSKYADFTDRGLAPCRAATCLVIFVSSLCWLMLLPGCRKAQEPALPGRILGGSMAPAFPGDHYQCKCEDCRFEWKFDFASAPKQYAVCPNCGFDKNLVEKATFRAAQSVAIVRQQHGPIDTWQRWDVVAFHHPEKPDEFGIKRIIGLPNERCEIKDGDIFIDGEMLRKNYAEQRKLAIIVFDSQYRATSQTEFARWKRRVVPSSWKIQNAGLTFLVDETTGRPSIDWLDYHHLRGYVGVGSPRDADAIEDADSYNQTKVRTLNRVRDLAVDLQIDGFRQGIFSIQFNHLAQQVRVDFNAGGELGGKVVTKGVSIYAGEELLKTLPLPNDFASQTSIYLSLFDRQILLAINQETVANLPSALSLSEQATASPISIGAAESQFKLSRLQIYRDLFYLDKYGQRGTWSSDGDGFVLLGDNVPISVDSRHWQPARVTASAMIGPVTKIDE